MDAFDTISEEFASTIGTSDPAGTMSERERSAMQPKAPFEGLPAAQQPASTTVALAPNRPASKQRRQATPAQSPMLTKPAGTKNTESQTPSDTPPNGALGRDEGARLVRCRQTVPSPLVARVSGDQTKLDNPRCHVAGDDQEALAPREFLVNRSLLVVEITQLWRMRQRWHRAEKSLILQGKAVCRAWTAGDKDEADKLYKLAACGEASEPIVAMALVPFLSAQEGFAKERAGIEKRLRALAQSSDLWPWVKEVSGFGPLNLAAVIGEAGEIADYRNPSCLWKRMGLAVIDGGRQRRVTDAEKALIHGYSPARRCVAYLLGDTLIKAGDKCRYRSVYAGRREHTTETHPDWTKAHSHNDAARYMVKRVLREMWCEARRIRRETAP